MREGNINILGVHFSPLSFDDNLKQCLTFLDRDEDCACASVFTPNPEMVEYAVKDAAYMQTLNSADLCVADGVGITIAAKLTAKKIAGRTPGIDLVTQIFEKKRAAGLTCYFLGAAPGVAEKAAAAVMEKYRGIEVVGTADGYFDLNSETRIIADIIEKKPQMLLVGLGFPKQEIWIQNNNLPVKMAVAVGGTFDVLSGNVKRAPILLRKLGLEWFYRLLTQPRRLKRMLKLPMFLVRAGLRRGLV